MYAFVSRVGQPLLRNGGRDIRGIVEGVSRGWCHLAAVGAPVGAAGREGFGDGGGSRRFGLGGTTKHHTAGEDGRLSAIIVGHLGLGVVDEDLGSTGAFPAGHLWLGGVGGGEGVDTLRVGEEGGSGEGGAGR